MLLFTEPKMSVSLFKSCQKKWTTSVCYLANAYIVMQLQTIHQRPRITIVYHMISEEIQNNLICIIRFYDIDILTLF